MAKTYKMSRRRVTERDPSILDGLNPEQREAAAHVDGPMLILAGAGSGKTRVITHRIANLIRNEGVDAGEILAVTFTNKAAAEMRERVDRLLEDDALAWQVTISTFHSLCARLLRRHGEKLGLTRDFAIYDQDDQTSLIKKVLQDEDRKADRAEIRRLRDFVERMKNAGHTPVVAHEMAYSAAQEEDAYFYEKYQEALRGSNCVDFGDLILGVLEMFRADPDLAKSYSQRWRYQMVDEFQDTNPAQYEFLQHLLVAHDNLCVVGDDDQSIYRWRGASVANILGFDQKFPETRVVRLEQNYRSTQVILDAAHDVIRENEERHPKTLWTEKEGGEPIVCFTATDEREEASWVVRKIDDSHRDGVGYREMAIFYRTNAQSRAFEEQLRFSGIPYQIIGGMSFYARSEVKDLLAYLKVALNPLNEIDLLRVINTPTRGVGASTIDKLRVAAALPQIGSLWRAVEWLHEPRRKVAEEPPPGWLPGIDASIEIDPELQALLDLTSVPTKGLRTFWEILTKLRDELTSDELRLAPTVQALLETLNYRDYLQRTEPERAEDKLRNVHELVNAIDDFEKAVEGEQPPAEILRDFLDRSALLAQTDAIDPELGAVTLMTVHSSKGLEFDTVFLAGMEDELFPSTRDEDPQELEEERRLAYVAITRAKRRLYMSLALERRLYGQHREQSPSRFLESIDPSRIAMDPSSASSRSRYSRSSYSSGGSSRWGTGGSSRRRRPNIGTGTAEWEYDQSPPMEMGAIKRAVDAARHKPTYDEYSQVPPNEEWDAPAVTSFEADRPEGDLVGAVCSHTSFGVGQIDAVSGSGDHATITVTFANGTQKKIKRKWLKILG